MGKAWTHSRAEEFVVAWQKGTPLADMAEQFYGDRKKGNQVSSMASILRKLGVPLHRRKAKSSVAYQVDALIALAEAEAKR